MSHSPRTLARLLLGAAAACLALPGPAAAERRGAFEIGAMAGFRFGARLEGRTDPETGETLSDLFLASGLSYGAGLGYWVNRTVMLEALWTHQGTKIENRDPEQGEEPFEVDVDVEDFLLGVAMHGGRAYDRVRWWGGAHVGGTVFRFDDATENRFAMSVSAGTRSPLGARVRLRTHARARWAYIDQTQDFVCATPDDCYRFPRSNWLNQWDLGVSFIYLI